jgi:hypothetical protein
MKTISQLCLGFPTQKARLSIIVLRLRVIAIALLLIACQQAFGVDPLDQWTILNPPFSGRSLSAAAYGTNLFVAVGAAGTILTSPDASSWGQRDSGTTNRLSGVAFGNDQFVDQPRLRIDGCLS